MVWMRLAAGYCIAAYDGTKAWRQPERRQNGVGRPLRLVGADPEGEAGSGQGIEGGLGIREDPAVAARGGIVDGEKSLVRSVDQGLELGFGSEAPVVLITRSASDTASIRFSQAAVVPSQRAALSRRSRAVPSASSSGRL